MHASGNLPATARAAFGPGAPQTPLSISESSLLGVERGKSKHAGKGFGLQDVSLWSTWLGRKGEKGRGESARVGPG